MAGARLDVIVNFGDIIRIDFGTPIGSEAGFIRPAVVLTADGFLRFRPTTVFVVPLTSTPRSFPSQIEITPDPVNGLRTTSWALVEQLRAVAIERCSISEGNVGPSIGYQLLETVAMIMGMP